jgi:hypothetical protein
MNTQTAAPTGVVSSAELGAMLPAAQDAASAIQLLGAAAMHAGNAAQAMRDFSAAVKKLEGETRVLIHKHKAQQPWWRRCRW